MEPVFVQDHDLAGFHVPPVLGLDQVQGAGLGGHHPGAVQLAQAQGPEAVGVPGGDDLVGGGQHQGIGAFDVVQGVDQGFDQIGAPRCRAMRWTMTSVSMVDWKMEPSASRRQRISRALVRVPLWPMAIIKPPCCTTKGWALMSMVEPVVE